MNNLELKRIRKELKKSQEELADFLKVSKSTVQKWEQGNRNIPDSIELLLKSITNDHNKTTGKILLSKEGVSFTETEVIDWVAENFDSLRKNNKYFDLVMQDVETKAVTKFLEDKGIKVEYK